MIQRGRMKNVCLYVNDYVIWYCYNRTHTKIIFISLCGSTLPCTQFYNQTTYGCIQNNMSMPYSCLH